MAFATKGGDGAEGMFEVLRSQDVDVTHQRFGPRRYYETCIDSDQFRCDDTSGRAVSHGIFWSGSRKVFCIARAFCEGAYPVCIVYGRQSTREGNL